MKVVFCSLSVGDECEASSLVGNTSLLHILPDVPVDEATLPSTVVSHNHHAAGIGCGRSSAIGPQRRPQQLLSNLWVGRPG